MTALKPRGAASSAFFLVATSAVVRGEARSDSSRWSPYDPVRVVNFIP
jgi:hypothetical protein